MLSERQPTAKATSEIFVVDDDESALESTCKILRFLKYSVMGFLNPEDVLAELSERARQKEAMPHVLLSDLRMPEMSGVALLKRLREDKNQITFVLMTAFGQIEDAIEAMRTGATDFIQKPFSMTTIEKVMERAVRLEKSKRGHVQRNKSDSRLSGNAPAIKRLKDFIEKIATSDASVLILGESGTGKERVALELHEKSGRSGKFVALNCGAIPENLLEAELFGFEKGSFTGASHKKRGLIEEAANGTLFLDEIGDLPILLQTKLLRFLQSGEVRPVGANDSLIVKTRVIAATHQKVHERVKQGLFREDLLFRLEVFRLEIPALRDRKEDISLLLDEVLSEHAEKYQCAQCSLSVEARKALIQYEYPGNIRELSNILERGLILSDNGEISLDLLPEHVVRFAKELRRSEFISVPSDTSETEMTIPLGVTLKQVEDRLIEKTLELVKGDKNEAARILGLNPRTIYRRLERGKSVET